MVSGVTSSGFKFEIDETRLDDMEFIDALGEIEENAIALSKVVVTLLGKEQRARLYDHVRNEAGRVPLEAITSELVEIMGANTETKNC